MLPVTATLAALCAFFQIYLTIRVILLRYKYRVIIGEIREDVYVRRNGVLSNFTANAPIVLILMALAELSATPRGLLVGLAVIYGLARISHVFSITYYEVKTGKYYFRSIGMVGSFLVMIILGVINLSKALG
jgi:uncharacterized membrane protein YecN with MAPEG domain